AHRIFIAALELSPPKLERGESPESLPALEQAGASLIVARVAIGGYGLVCEMETVEDHSIVLGARRSRGEATKQPQPHLLAQIVQRQRVFSRKVRVQGQRRRPKNAFWRLR